MTIKNLQNQFSLNSCISLPYCIWQIIFVDEIEILRMSHRLIMIKHIFSMKSSRLDLLTASFTFIMIKVQLRLLSLTTNNIQEAQMPCSSYCHNFTAVSFDNHKLLLIQESLENVAAVFNSIFFSPNCMLNFSMPDSKYFINGIIITNYSINFTVSQMTAA